MHRLRRLWLRAYRNYERAELDLAPGTTVLVGPNAQGKSNLLEAVYLVATGRSHRTAHEAEAIRFGQSSARVRARITRRGHDEEIEITLAVEDGRLSSQMRVNGALTPRSGVLGRLPVVLAAPWDLEVVRGPAALRRRLLDGALAQSSPAYYFALYRYHRVVAQRNAQLRQRTTAGLEAWDAQMVALGARITSRRHDYVHRLAPAAAAWFGRLRGGGALALSYRPSWGGANDEQREAEARGQLTRQRADELRRGASLSGPHRDDVELVLDGASLRIAGSVGQWRAAMLAVRLAERDVMADEVGGPPVLLLDDALAELDDERQARVLEAGGDAQVLLTATALPAAGVGAARVYEVSGGTLAEARVRHA
jgi:DNA replication and repair protein RecF